MKEMLLVFAGGGAGSVLRYLVSRGFAHWWPGTFPWGIFTVNVLGCLLIGLVLGRHAAAALPAEHFARLLLAVGFCGGFTTFSSFSFDNLKLLQNGQYLLFALYAGGSVALGLVATVAGLALSRSW